MLEFDIHVFILCYFRAHTEHWALEKGFGTNISPLLPSEEYAFGIGLVLVDKGFCNT